MRAETGAHWVTSIAHKTDLRVIGMILYCYGHRSEHSLSYREAISGLCPSHMVALVRKLKPTHRVCVAYAYTLMIARDSVLGQFKYHITQLNEGEGVGSCRCGKGIFYLIYNSKTY